MSSPIALPGLEHLIAVCRAHNLPIEQRLQVPGPRLNDALFGQAVDPQLSEAISRFNINWIEELHLLPVETEDGIEAENRYQREGDQRIGIDDELLQNVLLYARFASMPYHLATVPSLADANGLQPVVFLVLSAGRDVQPIASSVDMAFDVYARFLEVKLRRDAALIARHGSLERGYMLKGGFHFPDSIPEIIATDRRLVEMMEAHCFDCFLKADPELPAWISSVLEAARGRT